MHALNHVYDAVIDRTPLGHWLLDPLPLLVLAALLLLASRGRHPSSVVRSKLMNCRQCEGIESCFNPQRVAEELARYRVKGPAKKTIRLLIDALTAAGVEGLTLLDIGGGVGAIQHAVLTAGVSSANIVDASAAYIEAAGDEARRHDLTDRSCQSWRYLAVIFIDMAAV